MSDHDPYAPVTEEANPTVEVPSFAPAGEPEDLKIPSTEEASNVPEGSVKEVLGWVGEDSEKAKQALEAEEAGEGRKTLVSKLNEIINN